MWEDKLPHEIIDTWVKHQTVMNQLLSIELPRCLTPSNVTGDPDIHAFSDGGNLGYGTCIYLRWPTISGFEISYVASKAFVAPLKHYTTPRMELLGTVAMS